ncbi:MAG: histidine kinase [Rikenellaceae bacterium]|jgi:signal transduction histidine kinase|nr:histidine kinase [Rikenellaceae bacterium]
MAVKILLVVSILLQLLATIIAFRMIKQTKYNSLWVLLGVALLLMTASRILMFVHYMPRQLASPGFVAMTWIGIATSICLTVALFYARKLVEYIDQLIFQKQLTSKRILSAVLRTEEKERIRFSKELHDGLGPLLSSAKMSLSALPQAGLSEANHEIIRNTSFVIDEAIRSLREISNNLSPHVLNEFGLGKGVAGFVSRLGAMHDVKIGYNTNLVGERFDADVEVILYRIICELINNTLKHSGASEATLDLAYNGTSLTLDYSDNGRGFNPRSAMGAGMGLANITSRINTLDGVLEIESERGAGMRAHIEVDLNREDEH